MTIIFDCFNENIIENVYPITKAAYVLMTSEVRPTALQILERHTGKKVRVILDRSFGFEGVIATISQNPVGIWLSDAEAVVVRTTLANPLPQVVSREDRSEIFINLNSVDRIEVLH
jgi:hypothetical protein